jgi:hypothetical protein
MTSSDLKIYLNSLKTFARSVAIVESWKIVSNMCNGSENWFTEMKNSYC